MQKSTMLKKEVAHQGRKWYVIDATGLILGKLAVKVANLLRGKTKATFTPNVDCGDYVIITNASKVTLSGNKRETEFWYNHSHYMGGLRTRSGDEMIKKYPVELIEHSVKGMLPKNKLSRRIITKLFVYKDENHKHQAQNPIEIKL